MALYGALARKSPLALVSGGADGASATFPTLAGTASVGGSGASAAPHHTSTQ